MVLNPSMGEDVGTCTLCGNENVALVAANPGVFGGEARICAQCAPKTKGPVAERPAIRSPREYLDYISGDRPSPVITDKKDDPVDHPKHYTTHPIGVECIEITEHFTFNVGNAIKYLWRAGLKDGASDLEDLRKAAWYVEREIKRRERSARKG